MYYGQGYFMPFIRCTEPAFIQTFKDQLNSVRARITCSETTKVLKYERKDSNTIEDEDRFDLALKQQQNDSQINRGGTLVSE